MVGVIVGDDSGLKAQAEVAQDLQNLFSGVLVAAGVDEPGRLAVAVDAHAAGAVHKKRIFARLNAFVHMLSPADGFI